MSVYRRKNTDGSYEAEYSYDFRFRGHRFSGSTGETEKRRAEQAERRIKEQLRSIAPDRLKPMTFGVASTRWWDEVGQFHRNADDTERDLAWLQREIGLKTPLSKIDSAHVASLVAKRRADGVANATVNRTVIDPLRGILLRARNVWEVRVKPIDWKIHRLKTAQERVRELSSDEEARYFAALRPDYHPIIRFALLSGCRMQEMLDLEWKHIDWHGRAISVTGKGDKTRPIPLSDAIEAVLKPLPRADTRVFTYKSRRADHAPRGQRLPIEREGLKITHRRTCTKARIENFRFHDFRHTAATRLMRSSGNIKLVQRLLGHEDIQTTARYAHVGQDDLLSAMNARDRRSLPGADAAVTKS